MWCSDEGAQQGHGLRELFVPKSKRTEQVSR